MDDEKNKVITAARKYIDEQVGVMKRQSNALRMGIDKLEKMLTEGECFRSKEYQALVLMDCRVSAIVERVTEILNKN